MKKLFLALVPLFGLTGFTNNVSNQSDTNINAEEKDTTEESYAPFQQIDESKIASSSYAEADYAYNPYSIEDLLTKFYNPSDVEVMKVNFDTKEDSIVTEDGSIYTPYGVTVEETYNLGTKYSVGDNIVINNTGGAVPLSEYKPFIEKSSWQDNLSKKSDEWLNTNYYSEAPLAQKQSIEAGDEFLVMTIDSDLGPKIIVGNGLMEISGDTLINNDDTTTDNLSLSKVLDQITNIYK